MSDPQFTPPVVPVPAARGDEAALALRRAQVVQAAKQARPADSVQRAGPLDAASFRAFAAQGLPLVIEGLVGRWPISALKPDDLAANFGQLRVSPRVGDDAADAALNDMSLAEYLERIARAEPGPPPYVGDHPLPLPALCEWPDYFERWNTPRVWLGPAGTVTRLHCDYEDNLFAQVWGRKRFLLYSPACAELLALEELHPLLFISPFDPEQPDYARFPRARGAMAIECIAHPGDLLYVPAGWFHHVRALDFSLSVNRWTPDPPAVLAGRAAPAHPMAQQHEHQQQDRR